MTKCGYRSENPEITETGLSLVRLKDRLKEIQKKGGEVMGAAIGEQGTVIRFMRDEGGMEIYSCDSTAMTKLDGLCRKSDHYRVKYEEKDKDGRVASKTYERDDKRLLRFRPARPQANLTQEQRFDEQEAGLRG